MTITARREQRMREILDRRLGSVVVVLETVYRRHNVSAILRSAEGFGLHEVHLVTNGFQPSRGATRGAERWLDVQVQSDTETTVRGLQARGFQVWAADLHPDAVSATSVPVEGPIAILVGAELTGVSDAARAVVDGFVTIPMQGMTESLNVSVATACILSHITTRRRAKVGVGDLEVARRDQVLADWIAREDVAMKGRVVRSELQLDIASEKAVDSR